MSNTAPGGKKMRVYVVENITGETNEYLGLFITKDIETVKDHVKQLTDIEWNDENVIVTEISLKVESTWLFRR